MNTMKAVVVYRPGGPEALSVERRPIPIPQIGEVLIRVKAFGVNGFELRMRQGLSADVRFPRVPGIEAVGFIEESPGGEFQRGEMVATAMGGMGRVFDGSYAEYTCVPATQVQEINTMLPWKVLGALPEMLQTAWGALFRSLNLTPGERLLIRGGSTSLGLATAWIAKARGITVMATAVSLDCVDLMRLSGVDQVFIDTGAIADQVREVCPRGADKVLELVGRATLSDSLRCTRPGGMVCIAGLMPEEATFAEFSLMDVIPSAVCLTTYEGGAAEFMMMPLNELLRHIEAGSLRAGAERTFCLDEIADAHRYLEQNGCDEKIVVLV